VLWGVLWGVVIGVVSVVVLSSVSRLVGFAGLFSSAPPPPDPSGGGFGCRLFIDAQASISVPSTEKCSSESSGATSLWARTAASSLRAISVLSSRWRFFVNTVGTHTGSSMPSPTKAVHRARRAAQTRHRAPSMHR
jgi:hypothetical protein